MSFTSMQKAYDNRFPEEDEFYTADEALEMAQDEFLQNPDVLLEFFANISDEPVGRIYDEVTGDESTAHLLAVIINGFDSQAEDARYVLKERILKSYEDEIKELARSIEGTRRD